MTAELFVTDQDRGVKSGLPVDAECGPISARTMSHPSLIGASLWSDQCP